MDLEKLKRFDVDQQYPFSPWTHGGHSYATDGKIIVRCLALADLPENKQEAPRESAEMLFFEHAPTGDWVPAPDLPEPGEPPICPKCGGKTIPVCQDCNGTGQVTFEYTACDGRAHDHEADCPVCGGATGPCSWCKGTGIDPDTDPERKPLLVVALGVKLQRRYLRLIASLPGAQLATTNSFARVVAFRADGGVEGRVMPMRRG